MSYSSNKKGEDRTTLINQDGNARTLSWCPSLNIYRVNRFNILTNDKKKDPLESPWIAKDIKFDIIEDLLMHNLIHVAELIFDYVGFPYTWSCLRVNRLWYEFLAHHIFPRCAYMSVIFWGRNNLDGCVLWVKFRNFENATKIWRKSLFKKNIK